MAEMSQGGFFLLYLLSSILQADAPEKYCLSPKACRGILRRAQKRGKELPEVLRIALERQASAHVALLETAGRRSARTAADAENTLGL